MSVSTKMSVDVSGFTSGMQQAQTSIKAVNAMLKQNEAALKLTGNTEAFMQAQTSLLNKKLAEQQKTVDKTTKALEDMEKKGVDPASKAFVELQTKLAKAQTDMLGTQLQIQELGTKSVEAADKTDKLGNSVASIGKKMSLDQVINGINSVTKVMESAARTAAHLAEEIWGTVMDSAGRADNIATTATILGMDIEEYQKYAKVFATTGDITVQEWQKAKKKVQNIINSPSQQQTDILALLGINTHEIGQGKTGAVQGAAKNFEDLFWEIGETLRRDVASGKITSDMADTYAQALFGRSFDNLNTIFKMGREEFYKQVNDQDVVSEEAINKLATLNDTIIDLKSDFQSLQDEVMAGLAPALTSAAKVLDSLLSRLMAYLKTEQGQKALADLEKAVSGLFEDLGEIDPEKVVSGFTDVFNTVVSKVQWLAEHWQSVVDGMKGIVIGWGALRLTGGALQVLKLIEGLQGMGLFGGKKTGTTGGSTPSGGSSNGKATSILSGMGAVYMFDDLDPLEQHTIATNASKGKTGRAAVEAWQNALLENGNITQEMFDRNMKVYDALELTVKPVPREDAEKEMQEQIGTVEIPAELVVVGISDGSGGGHGGGGGGNVMAYDKGFGGILFKTGFHANGIWSVPTDNYLAFLHRGERVMPAREVQSRNYSSNMYIDKMIMNNGTDARGLADAAAAAQRRQIDAYGG